MCENYLTMCEERGTMDKKTQWHSGFCAAMELEFCGNSGDLEFVREYNLGRKPLQLDLLIIKKKQDIFLHNEIGAPFRKWNIVEYKSPEDAMSVDDFYKVNAYACLFKAQANHTDEYPASEITITMVRQRYPKSLMKSLIQNGFSVSNPDPGIYVVGGKLLFSTQIIVGCQLREQQHIWLRSLTDSIGKKEFNEFADAVINMKQPYEKECADAIMEVVTSSNTVKLRKWMEESNMTKELLCEILGPEYEEEWKRREEKTMKKAIQQGLQQGIQQGMQQGMHITKQVIRLDAKGCPVSEIAGKVGITEEQVREILA